MDKQTIIEIAEDFGRSQFATKGTHHQARSHGGGARGGSAPPGKNWAPLGCPPWHFIGIGIEVYSPPGILSAPPTNDTRFWPLHTTQAG